MNRRRVLFGGTAIAALASTTALRSLFTANPAFAETFEVVKTEEEWRSILSDAAYKVLREEDTEYPGTSELLNEKREGMFHCAGCDLPVYSSKTKYESGTGWPSFWGSEPNAIGTTVDTSLFMERIECHCRRCGGHFGHIFDDGPKPTGKRHCINGLALSFKPVQA